MRRSASDGPGTRSMTRYGGVGGDVDVEHGDDVRMGELGDRARLVAEPVVEEQRAAGSAQRLDRDVAPSTSSTASYTSPIAPVPSDFVTR